MAAISKILNKFLTHVKCSLVRLSCFKMIEFPSEVISLGKTRWAFDKSDTILNKKPLQKLQYKFIELCNLDFSWKRFLYQPI